MAVELGDVIGKIGGGEAGGGEFEIRNVDITATNLVWANVGEVVVTQNAMVSVIGIFSPTTQSAAPVIRVIKAGETETVDNSLRGSLSTNPNARNDALSVAGVLPPGTYTIHVNTQSSDRSFTVSTILISQTPTTHPPTL